MQLSSPPANNSPTVTQTATTVSQGVPQNQQNIVMVSINGNYYQCHILRKRLSYMSEHFSI